MPEFFSGEDVVVSLTDLAKEAEDFFHTRIPITRAMGVRVLVADDERFVVEAPVALNYNHMHTGFGGSINSIATLAGYGRLWVWLRERAAEVVIAESNIRFLRPVATAIRATCEGGDLQTFTDGVAAQGTGRLRLNVTVEESGLIAAQFRGTFAVVKPKS